MRYTDGSRLRQLLLATVGFCIAALPAGPLAAADESGYGFYRTVEGDVRLTTPERAEPLDVEPNYPLLLGDRVWVSPAGHLEAILPDQTILRAGGGTDLYFEDLALYAGETAGGGSVLRLLEGEVQIVISGYAREQSPLRVDTPNATIYLQEPGIYRIYADTRHWTEMVVREGFGEVVLAEGSVVVRANEEAVIDGDVDPRVRLYPAGALSALEAWGDELDREAELAAREPYVAEPLRYQAAPLRRHGEWLVVDTGYAWRPYVSVGWRPFTRGYWTHTPAGRYWVSTVPWGLTFHYGSWNLHPFHGWIWHPGRVFSPAWVTWYWGPTHVAWVPSGYYSHFYGHHGYRSHLGFGFYGWAGGSWGYYGHWTFCPTRYFGWRSYSSHWRSGHEIGRRAHHEVPRGLILGDTREIPVGFVGKPDQVEKLIALKTKLRATSGSKLPDVTDFVARQPKLSSDVRKAVFAGPGSSRSVLEKTERSIEHRKAKLAESPARDGSRDRVSRSVQSQPSRPDIERRESRLSGSPARDGSPDRVSRSVQELPNRPDITRRDLVTRDPVHEQPLEREVRSPEPTLRSRPVAESPSVRRQTPSRRESPSSVRSQPPADPRQPARLERSAPTREPVRIQERSPDSVRSGFSRQVRPGPSSAPPSVTPSRPSATTRVPVVRRVLDNIRGSSPSTSVRKPSTPTPRASQPSSGSSPHSSGKSMSKGSSSSSSSESGRSSGRTRSQSRPKSKPPGH